MNGFQETRQSATAIPLPPLQERTRDGIASTFSLIHETVSQFSGRMVLEMKRYNYVTPVNFLELVAGYKTYGRSVVLSNNFYRLLFERCCKSNKVGNEIRFSMLTGKRDELASQANKLRSGLSKIDSTRVMVNEMAGELEVTQEQVHKSTRECEEFLVTIGT